MRDLTILKFLTHYLHEMRYLTLTKSNTSVQGGVPQFSSSHSSPVRPFWSPSGSPPGSGTPSSFYQSLWSFLTPVLQQKERVHNRFRFSSSNSTARHPAPWTDPSKIFTTKRLRVQRGQVLPLRKSMVRIFAIQHQHGKNNCNSTSTSLNDKSGMMSYRVACNAAVRTLTVLVRCILQKYLLRLCAGLGTNMMHTCFP